MASPTNPYPGTLNSTLQELADPDHQINQGPTSSLCTVANMSHRMAADHPAEYAPLTADLSTTGDATLADGSTRIDAPPAAVINQNGGRSQSETKLQGALYAHGRSLPASNTELDHTAQSGRPGLTPGQQAGVIQSAFGRPVSYSYLQRTNGFGNQDQVLARARQQPDGDDGAAAQQRIRADRPVPGRPNDPQYVYYRDPTGADADRLSANVQPRSEAHPPGDTSTGIRRMRREDFERS